jgi:hypothetical protein
MSFCLILLFLGLMSASVTHAETYNLIATWGSQGSGNGQFNQPNGVAVDSSGNVYVADSGNNRIQKFDSSGKYLTQWGPYGTTNGQFFQPNSVAVDSSDNVYVADTGNNRIRKFDSSGEYITQWGSYGSGNGQFKHAIGVAVDSSGNVYVIDSKNKRIQKFDSSGKYLTQWSSYDYLGSIGDSKRDNMEPNSVAVDSSGNVYVAFISAIDTDPVIWYCIEKFDNSGKFLDCQGYRNGEVSVAVDSEDNIYVGYNAEYLLGKFDTIGHNGKFIATIPCSNQVSVASSSFLNGVNTIYVVETNNRVQCFILQQTPWIDWNNPHDICYGTPLGYYENQLNAVAKAPIAPVDGYYKYTADGTPISVGAVLGVGKHTLHVDFTPTDNKRYFKASKNVTINVSKQTPIITWNKPADIFYGTALVDNQLYAYAKDQSITAPALLSGTFVYSPPAGTVLNVGNNQVLHVDFTPTDTTHYTNASKNVTINVSKQTPIITWNKPADIFYRIALGINQLNAVTKDMVTGEKISGTFVYSPPAGTVLNIGNDQLLHVDFVPTDTVHYTSISKNVTINVVKQTPKIFWNNPANIFNGTALGNNQLNAVTRDMVTGEYLSGTFVYSPPAGTILGAGLQTLHVEFTPTDTVSYTNASKNASINVVDIIAEPVNSSSAPVITWDPGLMFEGTALGNNQLNAVATNTLTGENLSGTFVYSPPAGTILGAGLQTLHVDFTPTDTTNYANVSKNVTINVTGITSNPGGPISL